MAKTSFIDVLIIGSGIAALTAADRLSEHKNVMIITKSKEGSNSMRAQGGVATVVSQEDHWKYHMDDTLLAGCYHNSEDIVSTLVQKGPNYIHKLIQSGLTFDKDKTGKVELGNEGAHSHRRILHLGGDSTGKNITHFMLEKIKNGVQFVENETAIDLLVHDGCCFGVRTINNDGDCNDYYASNIVLATGGCGGIYPFTSNDPAIVGDGIAIAYRAGADIIDMEFLQFHPTLLNVNGIGVGLISEAVRGEGAILITEEGKRLMEGVHPMMELAPRDIVSREIHKVIVENKKVFLDISMIRHFSERFPTISNLCLEYGISLEDKYIPVVPGAHFLMGGIKTNEVGETSVTNLYAVGEVACNGSHGANRLASNSLLEGIVFGNELATHLIHKKATEQMFYFTKETVKKQITNLPEKSEIQQIMMKYVGIVRSEEGLRKAQNWFDNYLEFISCEKLPQLVNKEQIQIMNMLTVGWLITTSALERTESRGGHYRSDFPVQNDVKWLKQVIHRKRIVNENKEGVLVK